MAARVVIPASVLSEIEAAGDYIAAQGNPRAALALMQKLEARCASLSDFPERGVRYRDSYRRVFEPPYQIIYRTEASDAETVVYIVTVHHMSRSEPEV